jgi:hypothetical protein
VCCAISHCSGDNGSAGFSPRDHIPSVLACFEAGARRQAASLAASDVVELLLSHAGGMDSKFNFEFVHLTGFLFGGL